MAVVVIHTRYRVANLLSVTLTTNTVKRVVPQLGGVEKHRLTVNVVIVKIIDVSS
jgi:hypothetical protein